MNSAIPVLIVDDYPTMRHTIADVIRKFGFANVSFAEDGQMAWEMLQDHQSSARRPLPSGGGGSAASYFFLLFSS